MLYIFTCYRVGHSNKIQYTFSLFVIVQIPIVCNFHFDFLLSSLFLPQHLSPSGVWVLALTPPRPAPHPVAGQPRPTPARLPGACVTAERSLALTAGIRSAAARALEAPPASAASGRQARFQESRRWPGRRRGSRPWLWPRVGRGRPGPPAPPAAPPAASRPAAPPADPWPAPPRVGTASEQRPSRSQPDPEGRVQGRGGAGPSARFAPVPRQRGANRRAEASSSGRKPRARPGFSGPAALAATPRLPWLPVLWVAAQQVVGSRGRLHRREAPAREPGLSRASPNAPNPG